MIIPLAQLLLKRAYNEIRMILRKIIVLRIGLCLALFAIFPTTKVRAEGAELSFLKVRAELKTHFRWTNDAIFPLKFPFPPDFIPRGATGISERTVSPGSAFEVSNAALILDLNPEEAIRGRLRIHFVDLYNRNPTSTDQTVNLKEAWLLFGHKLEGWTVDPKPELYILFGKAPKFERQPERNLESYGLVSTAFNRFEDHQLQLGGSFKGMFWRAQISSGNPLFFRDPNALAGDNGNDDLRFPNPELHLNSGLPILYDAEVEDVQSKNPEVGGGIGFHFRCENPENGVDVLGFYYHRTMAGRADLRGTFYGGDLDLLDGTGGIGLPIRGNEKWEFGANLEARIRNLRAFGQIVQQQAAGLKRNGFEVEMAWRSELPAKFATAGKQLFTFIQPVIRVSLIDNRFVGSPLFVAPSTFWDWKKFDFGARLGLIQRIDLTVEYSIHDIQNAGPKLSPNEFLTTLRFRL